MHILAFYTYICYANYMHKVQNYNIASYHNGMAGIF